MVENLTLSDEPLDPSQPAQDRLDHASLAQRIAEVLESLRSEDSSSVLALIGAWGAGKTSTLRSVASRVETMEGRWLTATFNPWLFSDEESLLLGFLKTLQDVMPRDRRWKRARESVGRFGQAISPLGKLTSLVGG
ncbi:P-loop NTPase fold protein [Nocardioides renjunii]|uniref:P-loop NTPase fold protein n=1 Tax=Nocardioides renjunii TaxID=3095075 RepID=UPI0038621C20